MPCFGPILGLEEPIHGHLEIASPRRSLLRRTQFPYLVNMKLNLTIDSMPLSMELDDVIAGLLAVRLDAPSEGDAMRDAISRHLSDVGGPWLLDEDHMRNRILRRLILEIVDPALVVRYLMIEQPQ